MADVFSEKAWWRCKHTSDDTGRHLLSQTPGEANNGDYSIYVGSLHKDNHNSDFLCMQETWLLGVKLPELEEIDNSHTVKCKQGVDINKEILHGRPLGGLNIMF